MSTLLSFVVLLVVVYGMEIPTAQDSVITVKSPPPLPKMNVSETEISPSSLPQTSSAPIENTQDQIDTNVSNINSHECGISIEDQPFLFSGRITKIGENPWLASMFYFKEWNYNYRCSATIISNKHVITAAHCMKDQNGVNLNKEDFLLVMGKLNNIRWPIGSTIRGIKEYIVHPDYKHPADADLVIIVLDDPVAFNMKVKPICLWDESTELQYIVGLNGNVAGWDRDETKTYTILGQRVYNHRQRGMLVTSHEKCLWADDRFIELTSNRTFCAGDRSSYELCTGYSGSGFVLKRNGRWYLRGIVSIALADFVTRTCDAVFSDVAKFDKWIKRAMQLS